MRIAFTTLPVPGHLNSTTTLARRLKARGHDVVFIGALDAEPLSVQRSFRSFLFRKGSIRLVRSAKYSIS